MDKEESFHYTYSAKEQEEIKAIRKKYVVSEETEDRMEQLRRMDATVMKKATVAALGAGVMGALLLGCGMSLIMSDFGKIFGAQQGLAFAIGILTGSMGILLAGLAYPIYHRTLRREREKIAPEILRLTDELMK